MTPELEPPVLAMLALACDMTRQKVACKVTQHGDVRATRAAVYADMATSMCDLRTAANLARGVPAERITSLGYPDLEWTRANRLATGGAY